MELYYPLILDGATGTQLQLRGYDGNMCAEAWVLEHPEALRDFQEKYIQAGSHVIYAPTFGANRVRLEENGITGQTEEINCRLVQLSKSIAAGRALVAGDIAPTGSFLPPMGDTTFEELVDIYTEQVRGLEQGGVDLYVIETMMSVPEARAALLAVRSVSDKPVFVSFTCTENGKTLTGTDMTAVLVVMQGMGATAFGLNCSVGPAAMLPQIRRLHEYAEIPLLVKPNAGLPEFINDKAVYHCRPEEYTDPMDDLAEAGVCLFGACCGSTEVHIQAIAAKAASLTMHRPEPKHPGLLPLATNKDVYLLSPDVKTGKVLTCDDSIWDALEDEADAPEQVTSIRISSEEDLSVFEEVQYSIAKPLCLFCDDAVLLEKALRLYQGRAMAESSLPEEVLQKLQKKYGLVY